MGVGVGGACYPQPLRGRLSQIGAPGADTAQSEISRLGRGSSSRAGKSEELYLVFIPLAPLGAKQFTH